MSLKSCIASLNFLLILLLSRSYGNVSYEFVIIRHLRFVACYLMTFPVDNVKFTILSKVRNHFTIRIFRRLQILSINLLLALGRISLLLQNQQLNLKIFFST